MHATHGESIGLTTGRVRRIGHRHPAENVGMLLPPVIVLVYGLAFWSGQLEDSVAVASSARLAPPTGASTPHPCAGRVLARKYDTSANGTPTAQYQVTTLANGMRAVFVSSPGVPRAAASVDVPVGSFSNPHEYLGLAHFLEHMLFLGSARYPEENAFASTLAKYSGSNNAYTSGERTNYFFECLPEGLGELLDVFGGFFEAPLLSASGVSREVHAVANEHAKNRNNDVWRYQSLEQLLSVEGNPFYDFSTGNLDTLNKPGVRDALVAFHKRYYAIERMTLVVLAPDPLPAIAAMAEKSLGGIAPTVHQEPPAYNDPSRSVGIPFPYPVSRVGKLVVVEPVAPTTRRLYIRWAVRMTTRDLKFPDATVELINFILQHDGPGTFKTETLRRGYASRLEAGTYYTTGWFTTYVVIVDLTAEGVAHADEVVGMLFSYIREVRATGTRSYFEKLKAARVLQWHMEVASDMTQLVSVLSERLESLTCADDLLEPPERWVYDDGKIERFFAAMAPDNVVLVLFAADPAGRMTLDRTDPFYGTRYAVRNLTAAVRDYWETVDVAGMAAPARGLLYHTTLRAAEAIHTPWVGLPRVEDRFTHPEATQPRRLVSADGGAGTLVVPGGSTLYDTAELYHQRSFTRRPATLYRLRVVPRTPYTAPSPVTGGYAAAAEATRRVAAAALALHLQDAEFEAQLVGMSADVNLGFAFSDIAVSGTSLAQPAYLRTVLLALTAMLPQALADARAERLPYLKETVLTDLEAARTTGYAYVHAHAYAADALTPEVPLADVVAAVPRVAVRDVVGYLSHMFARGTGCQGLILGSFKDDAARAADYGAVLDEVGLCGAHVCAYPPPLAHMRDLRDWSLVQAANPNSDATNDAALALYQLDVDSVDAQAYAMLLSAVVHEPAFAQLRSRESLGYVAFCAVRPFSGTWVLECGVQGTAHDAAYLDARIEAFVGSFASKTVASMPADTFDALKRAQQQALLTAPVTLGDEARATWRGVVDVARRDEMWGRARAVNATITGINLPRFVEYCRSRLERAPKKLSVELFRPAPITAFKTDTFPAIDPQDYAGSATRVVPSPRTVHDVRAAFAPFLPYHPDARCGRGVR